MWTQGPVCVSTDTDTIRVDVGDDGFGKYLRVSLAEAVQLRDDPSRAITEAAQASAKTKAVEAEGTPA
jgi:hypothetical protein